MEAEQGQRVLPLFFLFSVNDKYDMMNLLYWMTFPVKNSVRG